MAIKKIALTQDVFYESTPIDNIVSDSEIIANFKRTTAALREEQKKANASMISPKVDDFLYAHCVMMHSAEAALIDQNTGELKKRADGTNVEGFFKEAKDERGNDTVIWQSPDNIMPYKNGNGDIFPESELKKAYKDWVGKPLCKDHVSDSVDGIRGIIVDTYYDDKFKRVHALFALDRKNYPDLARKVEAGYATNVSMGTAVGRSVCTTCGNVATVEAEFCEHVKGRSVYGEVNLDLAPIELSIVVTGADPKAKVKTVLAKMNDYTDMLERHKNGEEISKEELDAMRDQAAFVEENAEELMEDPNAIVTDIVKTIDGFAVKEEDRDAAFFENKEEVESILRNRFISPEDLDPDVLENLIDALKSIGSDMRKMYVNYNVQRMKDKYMPQATTDGMIHNPGLTDSKDLEEMSEYNGGPGDLGWSSGMPDGTYHQLGANKITMNMKTSDQLIDEAKKVAHQLQKTISSINTEEKSMSFEELMKRTNRQRKMAHPLGNEEKTPYAPMGDADKIRDNEDRQMDTSNALDTKVENPDLDLKQKLSRAELEDRSNERLAILRSLAMPATPATPKVVDMGGGKKVVTDGTNAVPAAMDEEAEKAEEDKAEGGTKKEAFMLGTEEPTTYAPMGDADKIRDTEDRQMTGDHLDTKADNPDEALKRSLHRVAGKKLVARRIASSNPERNRWEILAGDDNVLVVRASATFGENLDKPVKPGAETTYGDFFNSRMYGQKLLKMVKASGPELVAQKLALAEDALPMPAPEAEMPEDAPMAMPEDAEGPGEQGELELDAPEPTPAEDLDTLREEALAVVDTLKGSLAKLESLFSDQEGLETVDFDAEVVGVDGEMTTAAKLTEDMKRLAEAMGDTVDEVTQLTAAAERLDVFKLARQANRDAKLMVVYAMDAARQLEELKAVAMDEEEEVEHEDKEQDEEMLEEVKEGIEEKLEEALEDHAENDEPPHEETLERLDEVEEKVEDLEKKVEDLEEMEDGDMEKGAALKARRAARAALVAEAAGMDLDPLYLEQRKGGGPKLDLDTPVADDGDKVETLHETHEKLMEVATKPNNQVRMAAKKVETMVSKGLVSKASLDELVSLGTLDPEAVAYYKQYYGEVDGGAEFAKELTQEFANEKRASSEEQTGMRYKRATALALEAQDKGIVAPGTLSRDKYVDDLVSLSDEQFESLKRVVARHSKPSKTKVSVPQVGVDSDGTLNKQASQRSIDVKNPIELSTLLFGDK